MDYALPQLWTPPRKIEPFNFLRSLRMNTGKRLQAVAGYKSFYDSIMLSYAPTYWWKYNEASGTTATDSADSNPATYTGGVTLGVPGPVPGDSAALLNGTTGNVAAGNVAIPTGASTVLGWFQLTAPTTYPNPAANGIVFGADAGGGLNDHDLYMSSTGYLNYYLYTSGPIIATASAPIADTKWHMIVGTYDGSSGITLYLDGSADGTTPTSGASYNYSGNWRSGAGVSTGWTSFFPGSVAQFAVWNSLALTPTQIATLYAAA